MRTAEDTMGQFDESLKLQGGLTGAGTGLLDDLTDEEISQALENALAGQPQVVSQAAPQREDRPVWFLGHAGQPRGPMTRERVDALRAQGDVHAATLVWREGFADWRPLWQVEELSPSVAAPLEIAPLDVEPPTPPVEFEPSADLSSLASAELDVLRPTPPDRRAEGEPFWLQPQLSPPAAPAVVPAVPGPVPPVLVALLGAGGALMLVLVFALVFLLVQRHPRREVARLSVAAPQPAPVVVPAPLVAPAAEPVSPAQPTKSVVSMKAVAPAKAAVPAKAVEPAKTVEPARVAPARRVEQAAPASVPAAGDDGFEKAFGGEPAPVRRAAAGPAALPETLGMADIVAGIVAHRAAIDACTHAQAERLGGAKGTVVMRFAITPGGKATDIALARSEGDGGPLGECLTREMRGWHFPRHGGGPQAVEFPFRY